MAAGNGRLAALLKIFWIESMFTFPNAHIAVILPLLLISCESVWNISHCTTIRGGKWEEKLSIGYLKLSTDEPWNHLHLISKPNVFTPTIRPYSYWWSSVLCKVLSGLLQNPCSSQVSLEVPLQSGSEQVYFCLFHPEPRFKLCPEASQHLVCFSACIEESLLRSRPISKPLYFSWNRNYVGKDRAFFIQGRKNILL